MSDDDEPKACVGVVFQFNANGVLFEFPDGSGDDAIGFVKISDVKVNADKFIPPTAAASADKLSKYLQIGDEIRCTVEKASNLPMFEYKEEDEEVDANGDFKTTSKTVQVKPGWVAKLAELVVPVNIPDDTSKSKPGDLNNTDYEDDIFSLDIGDQLDYDGAFEESDAQQNESDKKDGEAGRTENGDKTESQNESQAMELDDVILLEDDDADILDFSGVEEGKKKEDGDAKSKESVTVAPLIGSNVAAVQKKVETFIHKARLVQLQKPPMEGGKTFSAILEITEGQFAGQQVGTSNWKTSVFGHGLSNATLTYFLNYGDECEVEYSVGHSKPIGQPLAFAEATPTVVRTWFGSRTIPERGNPEFEEWLKSRNTDEAQFLNWIRNLLPIKPYLPLPGDVYVGRVFASIQESNGSATCGLFVKVVTKLATVETILATTVDPEVPQDLKEDAEEQKKVAILMRDDLYICGVAVKFSDLKSLFTNGDDIKCQIRPITTSDRSQLAKELAQRPVESTVTHVAYLGYVGPKRPQQATLSPDDAAHLDKFLTSKGLSIQDFKTMRTKLPGTQMPPPAPHVMIPAPRFLGLAPPFRPPGPFAPVGQFQQKAPGQFPGVVGAFFPQVPPGKIAVATTVAAKAINFCQPPNESQIFTILENPIEVEVAVELVKNIAQSLVLHMKNNIQSHIASSAAEIEGQLLQARTAEQVLLKGGADKMPKNPPLQEAYKAVQEKMAQEAQEWAKVAEAGKSKPVVRDARKILDAYKAAKARDDLREDSSPLNLLREYVSENKPITSDKDTIWFGNNGFPATVLTNFKSSVVEGFYKLETLVHCVKSQPNNPDNFLEYARSAQRLGISPVAKQDIGPLMSYLSSPRAPKPANVVDISHRDLNPQLFNPIEKVAAWKEKFAPEKKNSGSVLSKMGDAELLAQAELQMAAAGNPPEKKRSRFDVTVHPTKGFTEAPPSAGAVNSGPSEYSVPPPIVLNPFAPPVAQPQEASRYLDDNRSRFSGGSRSPTQERLQEIRPLSPERLRSASFRSECVNPFSQMPDPFKTSAASPPRSSGRLDPGSSREEEELQMKLWQEFKREREARRRREEEDEEARRRAYEADRFRPKLDDFELIRKREEEMKKREADIERMRRVDLEQEQEILLRREEEEKRARARRFESGGNGDWTRPIGEFEKFEKEPERKAVPPPPPKIDLTERRAAPPPPALSQRAQQSSYRSQTDYEANSKARPDSDDYLRRRSEWDERTERRSWSREPEWDSVEGRAYRAMQQQRGVDDDERRRNPVADGRSASTETWPTIGGSSYDRRF